METHSPPMPISPELEPVRSLPNIPSPYPWSAMSSPARPAPWDRQFYARSSDVYSAPYSISPVGTPPLELELHALDTNRLLEDDRSIHSSPRALDSPSFLHNSADVRRVFPGHREFLPVSPGSPSFLNMIIARDAHTPLMEQQLHRLSRLALQSPTLSAVHSLPSQTSTSSRRLQSVSPAQTGDLPSPRSPSSAAAISALYTINQMQENREGSATFATPSGSPSGTHITPRHSLFYMQDEMIVLNVEDCLYKVHRHYLESSYFFRRRLMSRTGDSMSLGKTDDTAIRLSDVSKKDFDCLLNFFYFRVYEPDTLSLNEWISLLAVSTQLQFDKIRKWAVREITAQRGSLDAVEAVVLSKKYNVQEWLAGAYTELCRRRHPLDDDEADRLGARVSARIARARESLREETFRAFLQKRYGNRFSAEEPELDDKAVSAIVTDTFFQEGIPNTA